MSIQDLHEHETILAFYRANDPGWLWPEAAWWTPGQPLDLLPTEAQMEARSEALDAAAEAEFGSASLARFWAPIKDTEYPTGPEKDVSDWFYERSCGMAFWTRECMALYLEAFGPNGPVILRSESEEHEIAVSADEWLRGLGQ